MSKRKLREEEMDLWRHVTKTTVPLHPKAKVEERPLAAPVRKGNGHNTQRTPSTINIPQDFSLRGAPKPEQRDMIMPVDQSLSKAPVTMDYRKYKQLQRGKLKPEGRIDLHGMTIAQAQPALARFILGAQSKGYRLVLVITGKGRQSDDTGPIPQRLGILRHEVPRWLSVAPLSSCVQQVTAAHQKHGGHGAYYVYLRRMR